ncbi:aspartate aminotransferase family protein [Frankia sp. B2]|uniref:aspartate aminotransferase family protein n=1 Tax=unclassified Frankia TaxID=2632575 RepID=UPI0003D00E01|nr:MULTISPECIES: aspartate aminotransferase family protein [unclassified Frankia]ETA01302.1 glutamate-1-semialdehyde 2,1-aminomutase [Frankia sp. CcI6]KDA42046.1 glutamate-1-semialdehyde 2,1-aminomutase [Frankia sp. BMG5.23]KEZ36329.1 glutamate-1-semialdehyde 2,1-aminomutase [Frankia sp. CeD]KFB06288.1 glutamate-1-semialdehyde 2,1-aminomutase [Frankia sp. Allo2]OHV53020.1 glutamate-1-semialdehyde 2,1-aminomutase [Frankia sp. CgIS1]
MSNVTASGSGVTRVVARARVAELAARESARLDVRTRGSEALHARAVRSMTSGVPSSYQVRDPWPIYLTRGLGSKVWDVDGNEYSDFHNGFGSMVQGHAHPAIVRAVTERVALGTHFAMPTEDCVVVSEELARRFGLPQWRYVNSGSEATMDAIRIARGVTGRDTIVKIFGSYHGHHDYVMVSIGTPYDDIGPAENMNSLGYGAGIPRVVVDLTVPVPFNDAPAMERRIAALAAEGRLPACVIMEPAMMNLGVVLPEPGYLAAVREITSRYGVILIFDEVKTGLCVAAGGATERFGVRPDLVTLAKALGGGLPSGAIGATAELMEAVASDRVKQVGTYNGNPLTMAAARASLFEVLTPDAYTHLDRLGGRLTAGCDEILTRHGIPGYTVGISSKGCVHFTDAPIRDYTSFMAHQNAELPELAWLYNANRNVLMAPGREEEWTLSVQHTDADVDRYLDSLDQMARDLVG